MKGALIAGAIGMVLFAGFCAVVMKLGRDAERSGASVLSTPKPTPRPTPDANAWRRVLCENHKADDSARAFIFKRSLKSQRCDSIESAVSTAPCAWSVRCAPGYSYGFIFDKDGELISAVRLHR